MPVKEVSDETPTSKPSIPSSCIMQYHTHTHTHCDRCRHHRPSTISHPQYTSSPALRNHLCALALGVLLADVGDGKPWGKGLLKLLGLVGVLEDEGVDVAAASDLELDVVGLLVLLDTGRLGVLSPADLDELLDV